jgi:hypothetical protein
MKFYGKAEDVAKQIVASFEAGKVPAALGQVFIGWHSDRPCAKWSWRNRFITAIFGHCDARGYRQWQEKGRSVKKGEKAFDILAPIFVKEKENLDAKGKPVEKLIGFKSIPVFGYSQTEGTPLVGEAESGAFIAKLPFVGVAQAWGLKVDTDNGGGNLLGYYVPNTKIRLHTQNLSTWAHELAHAADNRLTKLDGSKTDIEVSAEYAGAVLLTLIGQAEAADLGGAMEYIKAYAEREGKTLFSVCSKVIDRVCKIVNLILTEAEKLQPESIAA